MLYCKFNYLYLQLLRNFIPQYLECIRHKDGRNIGKHFARFARYSVKIDKTKYELNTGIDVINLVPRFNLQSTKT